MKIEHYSKTIPLKEGMTAEFKNAQLTIKDKDGELSRVFPSKKVSISIKDNEITVQASNVTKREKKTIGTYAAHIRNMVRGLEEPFTYKLKVCASHFPMNVSVDGDTFVVKNYIGEVVPRKLKIKQGVKVNVEGEVITVQAPDKELAGQAAASIEQLCRRPNFDRRIFQDGIYIIQKDIKEITI